MISRPHPSGREKNRNECLGILKKKVCYLIATHGDRMGADPLPRECTVARTETRGHDEKNTYIRDLQVRPDTLESIDDIEPGDYLTITVDHPDHTLSIYGKVEPRTEHTHDTGLPEGTIGVGGPERDALGITPGDTVRLSHVGFEPVSRIRSYLNRLIGIRAITCRVRKAVNVDAGTNVCRLRPDVKQALGIEWGDKVVIQSSEGRLRSVKALPLTDDQIDIITRREQNEDEPYPIPFAQTPLGRKVGAGGEIPRVHIPRSARKALGITEHDHSGVYQPVKIHRDTRDVSFRLFDELTTPILLGSIAVIVGFNISLLAKIGILIGAILLVLASLYFRGRRVLLE